MFCPRCGTENQEGDRFCSSCGTSLGEAKQPRESRSARDTFERVVGTSRKARLVTAGTALAIVVAIVAFVLLKPSEEEATIPRDAYTVKADKLCIASKQAIVTIESQYDQSGSELATLASELVPVVGSWRTQMSEMKVPADPAGRDDLAAGLEAALLETEAQLGGLARVAKTGGTKEVIAKAKSVDKSTAAVEEAAAALGLTDCEKATIGFGPDKG